LNQQAQTGVWNAIAHPIAFILVLIGAFAETNRAPFDLAECEQELIAGYHTEYSAMKFGMFFLGEYAHMVTNSAMIVVLFFGGYHLWGVTDLCNAWFGPHSWISALVHFNVIWVKILVMLGFYMLIRWTLPRFRFDQLMRMAWKSLVPIGVAVVVATGLLIASGWRIDPRAGKLAAWGQALLALMVNGVVVAGALWVSARTRVPITGRQDYLPPVQVEPVARS
jgi:NADH-quinone oxidoreductase subunit H